MVKKRIDLPQSVVEATRQRLLSTFDNGVKVYLPISGGKDSIVLSHQVYSLIREGRIDPSLLTVVFIDEEAMFDDVIEIVKMWRKKFLAVGAKFHWYCVEVKHFSCFNMLSQDEGYMCWDSTQPENWIRPMPSFAITDHPRLKRRDHRYQEFLEVALDDGIRVTGVRVSESVQRLNAIKLHRSKSSTPHKHMILAMYDWKDPDVWRYIRDHELEFPDTYMKLYQVGKSRRDMRISQFFSIDTAKSLVKLSEFDPTLMERITRREPNAYLAALYWDTEMFRSAGGSGEASSDKNRGGEAGGRDGVKRDFKAETLKELAHMRKSDDGAQRTLAQHLTRLLIKYSVYAEPKNWKLAYSICVAGDPKLRSIRALGVDLKSRQLKEMRESANV